MTTETLGPRNYTGNAAWTRDPVMTVLIDKTGTYTYFGEAPPGTLTSAAGWLISRMDNTGASAGSIKQSSGKFDQVWNDRATSVVFA